MAQFAAGVDVGSGSVKIVLCRVRMRGVDVVARREAVIARDETGNLVPGGAAEALAAATADLPGWPGVCSAAIPGAAAIVRTVEVPRMQARKADPILVREIEDDLPIPLEEGILDHVDAPIPGRPQFMRSLVVVARMDRVKEHLDLLAGARLDPTELGIGGSVYASFSKHIEAAGGGSPVMVVDVGAAATDVAILDAGNIAWLRSISWGGDDVTRAIVARHRVTWARAEEYKVSGVWLAEVMPPEIRDPVNALVSQVKQTILSHAARTGRHVSRILVSGGGGLLKGLAEALSVATGTPVSPLPEVLPAEEGGGAAPDQMVFARALALARLAGGAAGASRLDFRKGPFAYSGQARVTRRRWVRAVLLCSVVVAGWLFYSLARLSSLESREEDQQERLAQLSDRYLGEEVDDFDLAAKLMQSARPVKSPMPPADAFVFLKELSERMPVEIVHDIEQLDIKPGKVQIKGVVDTIAARDLVIETLEGYEECVKAISKGKTTQSPKDNRQKYTLDLETACP